MELYKAKVNDQSCKVEPCRVSRIPFNVVWPGHQRDKSQTEEAAFLSCSVDEDAELEIVSARPFQRAVVRPLSRGIQPVREGDTLRFTLKPGQYTLELDGRHHALHIFIDRKKEELVVPGEIRFGPGEHEIGTMWLQSGARVVIERGARVYGRFFAEEAENIHICGQGILDGSHLIRSEEKEGPISEKLIEGESCSGLVKFYNCKNVKIEGITLQDSPFWTMMYCKCENVLIDNIKMIGMWRYNSDGVNIINTRNFTVKNSFFRNFDDVIVPNGRWPWMDTPTENVVAENCVIWCDWGRSLELGAITIAKQIRNITYRNCDLIHNGRAALSVHNTYFAQVSNVLYENINVEYSLDCQNPVDQATEDMEYVPDPEPYMASLIQITDFEWWNTTLTDEQKAMRRNSDIVYRNIRVIAEEGLPFPPVDVFGFGEDSKLQRVRFEGIYFNDRRLESIEELKMQTNGFLEDVVFV